MTWNWELEGWPEFRYSAERLAKMEADFLFNSGLLKGELRHVQNDDQDFLRVELISTEALRTSEIEGEILNRDSLQSSIRGNLGLQTDHRRIPPAEAGISEMMVNLYQTFCEPLTDDMLFAWHKLLMNGRADVLAGAYRVDPEPMQVVSGAVYDPIVHFEAPASANVPAEMKAYIRWFNETAPDGAHPLPPLTRAGLAHIYFECIHPFDDGNGRIGRALVEKALSQSVGYPTLIALSHVIAQKKKSYYDSLELNNKSMEITSWLEYFAETILEAQQYTLRLIRFLIAKAKLYDRLRGQMNERQEKAVARMFREGPEGFAGGMSAGKYATITGASSATATRDLRNLVEIRALKSTGAGSGMRYWLDIE